MSGRHNATVTIKYKYKYLIADTTSPLCLSGS